MRRHWVVGLAALLLLGAAAPAVAHEGSPLRSPAYLALGDSVPAGVGALPDAPGYPTLLEALLDTDYDPAADEATGRSPADFELVNLAEGGATTATLIENQLPRALTLIAERNDDRNRKNDVEVVTVTIGGNDVFGPVTAACITTAPPTGCQATVETALAGVEQRLTAILGPLVTAAGPDTEVVVTTYYNPIGSCFLTGINPAAPAIADVVLEGGTIPGVLVLQAGLNDVIREVAASTGAQVTDLYGELDASEYVGGQDCLHPNAAGHVTIAEELYATLAR